MPEQTEANVENIENALSEFLGDAFVPSQTEETVTPDESTETSTLETPAEEQDEQATEKTGETDTESTEESNESDALKDIPDAYLRAAKHQGLSDEDIADIVATGPDKAMKILGKLHKVTNDLSEKYSKLGANNVQAPAQQQQNQEVISGIDFKAVEDEWGADDPLVKMNKDLAIRLERLEQGSSSNTDTSGAVDALALKISTFMSSPQLEPFIDFYGDATASHERTTAQNTNYGNLLQTADNIRAGAALHGEDMSPEVAMERAHLTVSSPFTAKAERSKIQKAIEKRSKSITLVPAKSGVGNKQGDEKKKSNIKTAFNNFIRKK